MHRFLTVFALICMAFAVAGCARQPEVRVDVFHEGYCSRYLPEKDAKPLTKDDKLSCCIF